MNSIRRKITGATGASKAKQVLASNAVFVTQRVETVGAQILSSPCANNGLDDPRYGLGKWREEPAPDGSAYPIGTGGALGVAPWIDVKRNTAGASMAVKQMANVLDCAQAINAACASVRPG